jgi:hypothetical protein
LISWELPEETIEIEGKQVPITTSRFYTNSLGEKANLRKDLESWRGRVFTDDELRRFDLESILSKPCMLTIVGGENGKTKIAGVMGLPKNTQCPEQINPSSAFWLDEYDEDKFNQLSDGIKKIIEKSEEYPDIADGNYGQPDTKSDFSDDDNEIPF